MSKKYKVYEEKYHLNVSDNLLPAIVVDMDGTLAHMNGRSPFDDRRSHQDMPDFAVMAAVNAYAIAYPNLHILVVSGRSDRSKEQTKEFLSDYNVSYDYLFMRKHGDYRKDNEVKMEIFENHIKPYFNVLSVFDDRNQVVDMWRKLGLKVFQVQEGNF